MQWETLRGLLCSPLHPSYLCVTFWPPPPAPPPPRQSVFCISENSPLRYARDTDFKRKRNIWHYACEIRISPCISDEWFFPGTPEMRLHSPRFCKVDLGWHFHKWNKLFMGTTQCSLVLYYEELNRLQYQVLNKINYPCKDVTFPRFVSHPC